MKPPSTSSTLFFSIVLSLLILPAVFAVDYSVQGKAVIPLGSKNQTYTVSRVLDGDTFRLSNGQNLKLAGINTPELHDTPKLTQEAKKFGKNIWAYRTFGGNAHKLVEDALTAANHQIQLESDAEDFDEEGNLFAYVFVSAPKLKEGMVPDDEVFFKQENGYLIFLNAYLVKIGLAELVNKEGGKYHDLLLKLEKEAKTDKRGIWGS